MCMERAEEGMRCCGFNCGEEDAFTKRLRLWRLVCRQGSLSAFVCVTIKHQIKSNLATGTSSSQRFGEIVAKQIWFN